jgi:hypothetical protein
MFTFLFKLELFPTLCILCEKPLHSFQVMDFIYSYLRLLINRNITS